MVFIKGASAQSANPVHAFHIDIEEDEMVELPEDNVVVPPAVQTIVLCDVRFAPFLMYFTMLIVCGNRTDVSPNANDQAWEPSNIRLSRPMLRSRNKTFGKLLESSMRCKIRNLCTFG